MIEYTIQPTRKGDHIIRSTGGHEVARFPTEPEAQAFVAQRESDDAARATEGEAYRQRRTTFSAAHSDLDTRQLAWQEWRSHLYNELTHEARRLDHQAKFLISADARNPDSLTLPGHVSHHNQEEQRLREANNLYDSAVKLDTAIKAARAAEDADALNQALAMAEAMMTQNPHPLG